MRSLIVALSLAVAACAPAGTGNGSADAAGNAQAARMVAPVLTDADARDPHSYARPEVARVSHVALDLGLDFQARRVAGTATLDIQAADGAQEIVLDSKGLEIEAVTNADGGAALPFEVGAADPAKGAPLTIRWATHASSPSATAPAPMPKRCNG